MTPALDCPRCGTHDLLLEQYESMMVIASDFALFTVRCPHCGARVSGLRAIPSAMHDEVWYAAIEVGAGMGRDA